MGIFVLPLQLYAAWLVILVFLSDEPLRQRYFWYGVVAAVVMAIHLPLSIMLLTAFLFGRGAPWSAAEI